ncbi:hypothetical protein QL285_071658 [Trifolium repens]|nr:hypothetical protein QL285_071658 [Trifolium repens]
MELSFVGEQYGVRKTVTVTKRVIGMGKGNNHSTVFSSMQHSPALKLESRCSYGLLENLFLDHPLWLQS